MLLRTPGTGTVVITATGYNSSSVSQTIEAGAAASLTVSTQPVAGAVSGEAFATQPEVRLYDQYGNLCSTGPSRNASVTAAAKTGTGGTWSIGALSGESVTAQANDGMAAFVGLTCSLTAPGEGAITFSIGGVTVDSAGFTIPLRAGVTLTADTTLNNVDNNIEVTFGADADFAAAITGVSYNGHSLQSGQYEVDTVNNNKITLKPGVDTGDSAQNVLLRTPGTGTVVITATGYADSDVLLTILHGSAASITLAQNIAAPSASGGSFVQQPILILKDQYGNICTSDSSTQVTVSKKDNGNWNLAGTVTVTAVNGEVRFTDLRAGNSSYIGNAQLVFRSVGLQEATSNLVNLPAPVVIPLPVETSTTVKEISVDVKQGQSNNVAAQITVERTTDANGNKSDKVLLTEDKAAETIAALKESKETVARIVIPDESNEVSSTIVNLPVTAISILAEGEASLQIDTQEAKLDIPQSSLAKVSESMEENAYFRLEPIRDEEQKEALEGNAILELAVINGNQEGDLSIIGVPVAIETNIPSTAVDITLPLTGIDIPTDEAEREDFFKQLAVYIEHSDGEKELLQGEIVEYGVGMLGIRFRITKFSIFIIVKTDAFAKQTDTEGSEEEKSSSCDVTKVIAPLQASIGKTKITATVPYKNTSLTIKVKVSPNAVWKLYSDKACTKAVTKNKLKLNVGTNKAYLLVTAEDGTTKKYTLSIIRKNAPKNVVVVANDATFTYAMAGGILAAQRSGEVISTGNTKKSEKKLVNYIKQKYTQEDLIYLVGLSDSVYTDIVGLLKKAGYRNTIQIGGANQYETARLLAEHIDYSQEIGVVLINAATEPEEAETIQKQCAKYGYPILFVKTNSLTADTIQALKEINPAKIYLAGSKKSISNKVVTEIKKLTGMTDEDIIRIEEGKDIK